MTDNYHHPQEDFLRKYNVPAPVMETHGTEDDIRANLKQLMPNTWTLEGNQLKGQTEMGELVQTIPTSHILVGTDNKGLPIFRKVLY